MPYKLDSEMWNRIVQDAIRSAQIVDRETGCHLWIGETSRWWGYPVVLVEGQVINVRQWNAPADARRRGHVTFFEQTCGNNKCVFPLHMTVLEVVPVNTVRAMEAQTRAERRAA